MGRYSQALSSRVSRTGEAPTVDSAGVTVDLTLTIQRGPKRLEYQLSPEAALSLGETLMHLAKGKGAKANSALCVGESRADGAPLDNNAYAVVLSTERPVPYSDCIRIWDHSPGAVLMAQQELPLQFQHDGRNVVGVIRGLRLQDRKLHGIAYFSATAEAQAIRARVDSGELRGMSVTARDVEHVPIEAGRRVMKWFAIEASVCQVPANPDCSIRPLSEMYA